MWFIGTMKRELRETFDRWYEITSPLSASQLADGSMVLSQGYLLKVVGDFV